jgi:glyoxylate reductase
MKKIYITRKIPEIGVGMLREKGYEIDINTKDRPLSKRELLRALRRKPYDAVLTLLTDQIDKEVFDACPSAKIYANFAIGFNNIDTVEAKNRGIFVTNTPGGGAERVAEHAWALILALTCRVVEGDKYLRKGKFKGWDPLLLHGTLLHGKTLGIIGTGRIGADVAQRAVRGFGMKVAYYDVKRNEDIERDLGATFYQLPEDVLKISDIVSLHVPLLDSTKHLINEVRLRVMKPTAYLINTSRGPVVDETALVSALEANLLSSGKQGIRGAGLDVFENEPKMAKGLDKLPNVVITPHIASATEDSRGDMAVMSVTNIIAVMEGKTPPNVV